MSIFKTIVKSFVVTVIIGQLAINSFYICQTRKDVYNLSLNTMAVVEEQIDAQKKTALLTYQGFMILIQYLDEVVKKQEYIIDQNRANADKTCVITPAQPTEVAEIPSKPSYKELKSHNVFIFGCSGKKEEATEEAFFPLGEKGTCWSGTGVVIKITDTETYILTNNHVSGKGQKDVVLYVENGEERIEAEIIAQHEYVDAAVIKVNTILIDKTAIPGIATAKIQDAVYTVGNPLGVKNVYSEGVVAGYSGVDLLIQMPCIFGSSGSGVFNDEGKLVALVYALEGYPGFLGMPQARITHSLCVDSVSIENFLKELNLYEKE